MCKTICAGVVVAFLMTIVGTFGYVLFLSIYDCKVHSVLGLIIGLMVLLGSVLLLGSRLKKDMALINGQGESATRFPILTIAMKYTIIPVLLGGTMLILSQEEGGWDSLIYSAFSVCMLAVAGIVLFIWALPFYVRALKDSKRRKKTLLLTLLVVFLLVSGFLGALWLWIGK